MKALGTSCRRTTAFLLIALLAAQARGAMITEIVVFGDSLSDTGNVRVATQFSQLTSNKYDVRPDNPWYDKGRWTNGTGNTGSATTDPKTKPSAFGGVWHEQLADLLKIDRQKSKLEGGNNWAFGGATTGPGTFAEVLLNVGQQVKMYLDDKPTIKDTQLFAVWGGGNDLRDAAMAGGATIDSIKAAAATALTNMKNNIADLAAKGAKWFIWPNLPPLEKTPEGLGMTAAQKDGLKQASEKFRDEQAAAVKALTEATPGLTIQTLDVHSEFLKIVAKPSDFGLNEVTKGVVNVTDGKFSDKVFRLTPNFPDTQVDSDKFLFWDQIHPSAKTHSLIAAKAYSLLVPEPASLTLVATGFIVLVFRSRMLRQLKN